MMKLEANYFSGKISRKDKAIVSIFKDTLEVAVNGNLYLFNINECEVGHIFKNRPAIVILPDQSRLEILFEENQFENLKDLISNESHFFKTKKLLLLTFSTIIFVILIFNFIIPLMSSSISKIIPDFMAIRIDSLILENLNQDKNLESTLPIEKQEKLKKLLISYTDFPVKIYFKNIKNIGPNAFALAHHSIIITDKLVELLEKDELIVSVFLHEVGHLKNKHVLNKLVSALTFQAFLIFTTGQSNLAQNISDLSSTFALLKFSREFENEADEYAINQLINLNYSPRCLAESFKLLTSKSKNIIHFEYFSTHPDTQERIKHALSIEHERKFKYNCED